MLLARKMVVLASSGELDMMQAMLRRLRPLLRTTLALLLAVLGGACLRFERQTLVLKMDPTEDVLHVRLLYEGLFEALDPFETEPNLQSGLEDLARLEHSVFLLLDWAEFDLRDADPETADGQLVLQHISLRDHGLFLNAAGRLCAWQDLQVERPQELLAAFNALINEGILDHATRWGELDPEVVALNQDAAARGHSWIHLDPEQGLSVSFVAPPRLWARWKEDALRTLLDLPAEHGTEEPGAPAESESESETQEAQDGAESEPEMVDETGREMLVRLLARNRLGWSQRGSEGRVTLSPLESGALVLHWWNTDDYRPNLLQALREGRLPGTEALHIDPRRSWEGLLAEHGAQGD